MKKIVTILICVFLFNGLNAQRDSLKKIKFSGFQVDFGTGNYPEYRAMDQSDYQKIAKTDPLVNADLSGYKKQSWSIYGNFNALIGFKFYADINDGKKLKKEIFIGLKYGQELSGSTNYYRETHDTLGVYVENSSNQKIYNIGKTFQSYNFGITSQKLLLPFGLNFHTNKSKVIWFTYGIELAPALTFNYVLKSNYSTHYSDVLLREGDSLNSSTNYGMSYAHFNTNEGYSKRTNLSGMGFGLNAALPLSIYLRPSKRIKFLKHINLMASLIPSYFYSHSKYAGSSSMFGLNVATGIRYNW